MSRLARDRAETDSEPSSFAVDEQWRAFVRRHIVDDAPDDLREVEAMLDASPRSRLDIGLMVAIGLLTLATWGLLILLLVRSA